MMDHKSGFIAVLYFFIVSVVTAQENDRTCPHRGVNFRGRCFWFTLSKETWSDAAHLCHNLYGDHVTLVTIKDRETSDFIRRSTPATVWIGLHEAHGETQWRWVDNTEPANGNFRNWEPGAPETVDAELHNCAVIYRGADLWRDVGCKKRYKSICAELPSAPMCPNGGTFFRDRCYWRGASPLPWAAANQACQVEFGPEARLAVARDAEVNLFLSRLVYPSIWLGLSDKTEEHVWKWVNNAPVEYSNWRAGEPNNIDQEDCAVLHYDDATWNDQPCGDPVPPLNSVTNMNMYICALPPCYERTRSEVDDYSLGSGSSFDDDEDVEITDDSICTQTECTQLCVAGAACNATGQCICVRQFPEMTCDFAQLKVVMENDVLNATTGGSLTLKCKVNLPVDHIVSLTWSKSGPQTFSEDYTTITNVFSQGYSTLHISNVTMEDAGQYLCQAVLSFGSVLNGVTIPEVRSALVYVTEDAGQYLCQAVLSFGSVLTIPEVRSALVYVTDHLNMSKAILSGTKFLPGFYVSNCGYIVKPHQYSLNEATTPIPTTGMTTTKEATKPIPTTERTTTKGTTKPTPTTKPTTERTTLRAITQPRVEMTTASTDNTSYKTSTHQTTSKEMTTTPYKNDLPAPTKKGNEDKDTNLSQGNDINTIIGEGERANNEASVKRRGNSSYQPARGATAAIAILSIMVALLLVAVVGLMMKIKRMEGESFGVGRLVELQEIF